MSFEEQHPNYKSYEHDTYSMTSTPYNFISSLNGFIHGSLMKFDEEEIMSNAIQLQHKLLALVNMDGASQGTYDNVRDEISRAFRNIEKKGFHIVMEALSIILVQLGNEEDFNDFLEENGIGYSGYLWQGSVTWETKDEVDSSVEKIEEVILVLPNEYKDTLANLEQARKLLNNITSEKDLKNALRDCISAVEGYLKSVTKTKDFKEANAKLLSYDFSYKIIVTDAIKIWKHIHEDLLDVRHGNNENISNLGIEEVTYYIERLMAYIKYVNKKLKKI